MVEIKKIELPLQRLRNQIPTDVISHFIELGSDKIRWYAEFYADEYQKDEDGEYDKSLPMVNVFNFFDMVFLKNRVSLVQMVYTPNVDLWKIQVQCFGTNEDINIYLKSRHKSEMLKDEILQWLAL